MLVVPADDLPNATKPFLKFETLTLAPFDPRLVELSLLTQTEIDWLDAYHARVVAEISPHLDAATQSWLRSIRAPVAAARR